MEEKNLNFDEVIDRRNTDCLKFDFAERRGKPADVLPLWVADMDFKTSSLVLDALTERVQHGIFGYTESRESYFEAVSKWMEAHHDWKVERSWLTKTPGVVFALAMAVKAYSKAGDAVLIQQPVYYPFSEVIRDNNRKLVSNDLVLGDDGKYHIDFDDFEKQIVDNHVVLFLLCSPHNPVSRVWTREELEKLGDICKKHGVIVVSDEIHADFVFDGKHQVFADLKPEYKDFTVICTSPGKTFNIAGLQASNILIPNEALREAFAKQITAAGYSQISAPGIEAVIAAYAQGEEWYQEMKKYVGENITFLHEWMEEYIPQIKVTRTEGTYLVWMDFRGLGIAEENLKDFVENRAGLWLDGGKMFGESGSGFQRINVACPRKTLEKALTQLENEVKNL